MKILLTGASGFLGSALALRFRRDGHQVRLLLRASSSLARLCGVLFEVNRLEGDQQVAELIRSFRPDAVVHTACAYGRHGESLLQLIDANVRLGIALLQPLLDLQETAPCLLINTSTALPAATSAYALSKRQFAQWGRLQALAQPDRLRFINVELQHMYGPGDDASKFTTHVITACRRNEPELLLTAGEQQRDFIFLDDVVDAYAVLLRVSNELGAATDVPIGSGKAPPVREFVQEAHRLCRSTTQLRFGALPYRPAEAMHCCADLTMMHALGWSPRWSLEAGICSTIEREAIAA